MAVEIYFCKMHTPIRPRIPKNPLLLSSLFFFLLLFLIGCAGKDRVLTQEYANAKFSDKTMLVFGPDPAQIQVENPNDLPRCFPREEPISVRALLAEEFRAAFFESLRSHADYVKIAPAPDSFPAMMPPPDSQKLTFVQPGNPDLTGFTYTLPTRAWLSGHGVEADLGLFVQSLESKVSDALLENPKIGGVHETSLILEGRYVLWDYAKNLPVAYGRFRSEVGFKQALKTKDWMKAFDKAGRQVVERSPFKGEKWLKREE